MSQGYSGTPLARKLGIKPHSMVALVRVPDGFVGELSGLPEGVVIQDSLPSPGDWTKLAG